MGPGAVEDSLTPSPSTSVASKNVVGDEPEDADTPEVSRPHPRVWQTVEVKKMKMNFRYHLARRRSDTPVARVGRKKGKEAGATQFLLAMSDCKKGCRRGR